VTPLGPPDDPVRARFGFPQAHLVSGFSQALFLTGQVGDPHEDLAAQLRTALGKVSALLAQAGMAATDLMTLTILTTDVEALLAAWPVVREHFAPGHVPPNTLAQVSRFAHPGAQVEINGTAVS